MKRFQECSKIEKMWRYRWYLTIPFTYIYYRLKGLKFYKDKMVDGKIVHTDEYEYYPSNRLWGMCKSITSSKMNWTYTSEEVMDELKNKKKN